MKYSDARHCITTLLIAVVTVVLAQQHTCPRLDINYSKLQAYCPNSILQNIARAAFINSCASDANGRNQLVDYVSAQLTSTFASTQWVVALVDTGSAQLYDFRKDGNWPAATACMAFGTTGQHALILVKVDWATKQGSTSSLICFNGSYGASISSIISSNGASATGITNFVKRNVLPSTWTSLAIGVRVTQGGYSITQRNFYLVDSNQCNTEQQVYSGSNSRIYWVVINAKISTTTAV